MKIIGNKSLLAIELGSFWEGSKQHQDIKTWINGENVSGFDSVVYLPSYYTSLNREIDRLKKGSFYSENFLNKSDSELFQLMYLTENDHNKVLCYDITVCSVDCYFVNTEISERILYSFRNNKNKDEQESANNVFSIDIRKELFLSILIRTVDNLSTQWY